MENLNFFANLDKFGAEVFVLAFAVCACVALAKKLFPDLSKQRELALRFILAVVFYALYVTLFNKELLQCLEKGASICGVSYFVRSVFSDSDISDAIDEVINATIPKAKLTKKQLREIKSKNTKEELKSSLQTAANGKIPETKLNVLVNMIFEIRQRGEKV